MSGLNALLWVATYFFVPLAALAWCIDLLERKVKGDKTNESEVSQDPSLR
ncbi:hypothetical protein SEA_DREAMTEAM1_62 [Mycobacterium phage DreamTeam1]|nr:hypothetical protein SEA_DREAMTEAM1_62 [Mycobacterium phage DreamTeam1]